MIIVLHNATLIDGTGRPPFERAAAIGDEMYDSKTLMAEDESLEPWESSW